MISLLGMIVLLVSGGATAGENWRPLFNGKNLDGWDTYRTLNDKEVPLRSGKIQIQSEGAEVFYRNIEMKHIDAISGKYLQSA